MSTTSTIPPYPVPTTYQTILYRLTPPSLPHSPLSLPTSPIKPHIAAADISSPQLHPVIEAAFHILNHDLPSAHFLLRHMQAPPAWEAMYLHGILHRVEGDLDNARAWYTEVESSEVLEVVWGHGHDGGQDHTQNQNQDQNQNRTQNQNQNHRNDDTNKDVNEPRHHRLLGPDHTHHDSHHPDLQTHISTPIERAMSFIDQVESYKSSLQRNKFKKKAYSPSCLNANSIQQRSTSTDSTSAMTSGIKASEPLPSALLPSPPSPSQQYPHRTHSHNHTHYSPSVADVSLQEILRFLAYCQTKFGTEPVVDARDVWVCMAEKHNDKAAEMITGGEGWREF